MDRWSARVVSPLDLSDGVDSAIHGHPVIVHPGWGKDPQRHKDLLVDLADAGFCAIGIDTRYAYADRTLAPGQRCHKPIVGVANPYFDDADRSSNRWKYRRPTVTLEVCRRLGIGIRSYVGHSEGGRISSLSAAAMPELTRSLVLVNAAGTGNSRGGTARLLRSNANRVSAFAQGENGVLSAAGSAVGSVVYASTHIRRTLAEKQVIQSTNTWNIIDRLQPSDTRVSVLHAKNDELIAFVDSQGSAADRPWVTFMPTEGDHSNVYQASVRKLIVQTL